MKLTRKGYLIYNLKTNNVDVSRSVIFQENNFPKNKNSNNEHMSQPSLPANFDFYDDSIANDINTHNADNNDIIQNFVDLYVYDNTNSLVIRRTTRLDNCLHISKTIVLPLLILTLGLGILLQTISPMIGCLHLLKE